MPRPVEPAWKHDPENGAAGARRHGLFPWGFRDTRSRPSGHRIYARMGAMSAAFMPGMGGMGGRGSSSIIALDWNTQGKLLWERKSTSIVLPNRPADGMAAIGRSVSRERRSPMVVTFTSRSPIDASRPRLMSPVFDADTGVSRWIRYLGTASPDGNNFFGMPMQMGGMAASSDFNHRLLSLDGPALYYQTNLGALVALEAETGATLWVATYPRQEPNRFGDSGKRAGPESGGRPRRPGVRGPQRRRCDLRFRRRQRPAALEERSDCRRRQALSPSGRGQGSAGRHRQPRPTFRRQDREIAPCLARLGQVAGGLRPRAPGR